MSRRPKYHEEEEPENHERWLVTYADMLTVLMALFLVMFAISVTDQSKAEKLAGSVRDYFGTGPTAVDGGEGLLEDQAPGTSDDEEQLALDIQAAVVALDEKRAREEALESAGAGLREVQQGIEQSLLSRGLSDAVRFQIDERGLVITIVTDEVLFDLGSAALRPAGSTVLDAVVPPLAPLPNQVSVEGHTDNLPLRAGRGFATNWELSAARATSVLRYMLEGHGIPAARLSAVGYADQRPLVENTPARRATNRRVEVIVRATAETTTPAAPSGAATPVTQHDPPPPPGSDTSAAALTQENH